MTGREEPAARAAGSVAAALIAVQRGAIMVRVHDVAATVDALAVWRALDAADVPTEAGFARHATLAGRRLTVWRR